MKIVGLSGADRASREKLVESLVAALSEMGFKVSVAMRMKDEFEIDRPGKDSYEHRRAGASEVVLASSERWAMMSESAPGAPASLASLLPRMDVVDILLADGFEAEDFPRMHILMSSEDLDDSITADQRVIAVLASDVGHLSNSLERHWNKPAFRLDDTHSIATFIKTRRDLGTPDDADS